MNKINVNLEIELISNDDMKLSEDILENGMEFNVLDKLFSLSERKYFISSIELNDEHSCIENHNFHFMREINIIIKG